MNHRGLGEVHASDMLVKEASLSRRSITAKTVNEELHALEASCQRIKRRLEANGKVKRGDCPTHEAWCARIDRHKKLGALLETQETKLALCIAAAQAGRTYRHR